MAQPLTYGGFNSQSGSRNAGPPRAVVATAFPSCPRTAIAAVVPFSDAPAGSIAPKDALICREGLAHCVAITPECLSTNLTIGFHWAVLKRFVPPTGGLNLRKLRRSETRTQLADECAQ